LKPDSKFVINEYPSYQDEEMVKKKQLLKDTIDKIKDLETKKENSIFKSKTKRFSSQEESGDLNSNNHTNNAARGNKDAAVFGLASYKRTSIDTLGST
jgi:hypothetical protein